MKVVNLARRPFVNDRPIVRLAVALWLLGAFFLALNLVLYLDYWIESAETRGQLAALDRELDEQAEALAALDEVLARLDIDELNGETELLNQLIKDRTFPWSLLFDELVRVLPLDVKLVNVQPVVSDRAQRNLSRRSGSRSTGSRSTGSRSTGSRRGPTTDSRELDAEEVMLNLSGQAKTPEALYQLVDRLYQPPFRDPFLPGETRDEQTGLIHFNLTVVYRTPPRQPSAAPSDVVTTADAEDPATTEPAATTQPVAVAARPVDPEADDYVDPEADDYVDPEADDYVDPEADDDVDPELDRILPAVSAPRGGATRDLPARPPTAGRAGRPRTVPAAPPATPEGSATDAASTRGRITSRPVDGVYRVVGPATVGTPAAGDAGSAPPPSAATPPPSTPPAPPRTAPVRRSPPPSTTAGPTSRPAPPATAPPRSVPPPADVPPPPTAPSPTPPTSSDPVRVGASASDTPPLRTPTGGDA